MRRHPIKVLVTGGTGFLGGAVCRQLAARGEQVVAYQRSDSDALRALDVDVRRGEITDAEALLAAARGCHAVIHTAALAGVWGKRADFERINIDGTDNVVQVCRDWGIPHLVYTSTPSVVHDGEDIQDANEFLPYPDHFLADYPRTKAEAEHRVLLADREGLRTVALRPHLIWGPGDPHFLPRLKEKARDGVIRLPGPEKRVDTTFIENAARAHLDALDELRGAARCGGKPYFISDGQPLKQGEFISAMLAAAGQPVEVKAVPPWLARGAAALIEAGWRLARRDEEPPLTRFMANQLSTHHWFDISAAREDFGYDPPVSIREGLRRLAEARPVSTARAQYA